jgi:hypothetical protein
VFLGGINSSKRVARMWKMMKEVIEDLIELMKMLKGAESGAFGQSTRLIMWRY